MKKRIVEEIKYGITLALIAIASISWMLMVTEIIDLSKPEKYDPTIISPQQMTGHSGVLNDYDKYRINYK